MALIAVVCDTYKKDKFREALVEAGIKIIFEGHLSTKKGGETYLFKVESEPRIVAPITQKLQQYYHDTYKRGN